MAKKQLSAAQEAALAKGRATRDANRQNKNTSKENSSTDQDLSFLEAKAPEPQPQPQASPQLITLSPEQLQELVNRLVAGQITDKAPAPSMTPGVGMGNGLQTNSQGQVVGHEVRWDVDPNHYPNPVDDLLDDFDRDPRMRRHNVRENYFITWDIDSKPYDTKYGISVQEPFFHVTLYMNLFDEQGEETGRAIIVQTLHFNEDQGIALAFAAEKQLPVTQENMKNIMDQTRYERVKAWLTGIFYPPKSFTASNDAREEAIGGQVVKVVTKSNVKGFGNPTPKISDEELQ